MKSATCVTLQVGVAPGFSLRARADGKSTTQIRSTGYQANSTAEFEDQDVKDDINNINLSMVIGAGVEYNLVALPISSAESSSITASPTCQIQRTPNTSPTSSA